MTPHETHDTISVLVQDSNGDLSVLALQVAGLIKCMGELEIVQSLDQPYL